MGASTRSYPEGVPVLVALQRDQAKGASYIPAESEYKPVHIVDRLKTVEETGVLVLQPDSVGLSHGSSWLGKGVWSKVEPGLTSG